jgi:hypothetical protein
MSSAPNPSAPVTGADTSLVSALVCAGISAVFMQSGFLSLFFLIPLGYLALVYTNKSAWTAFLAASVINALFTFSLVFFTGSKHLSVSSAWIGILYYTVITGAFTWIMAGTERGFFRIRTLYRLIAGSLAGAAVFLFVVYAPSREAEFVKAFRPQAEMLSSLYVSAAGSDTAKRSLLEQTINADMLLGFMKTAAFRGGAVVSCFLLFFISRSLSDFLVRIFRRRKLRRMAVSGTVVPDTVQGTTVQGTTVPGIALFHAPPEAIWVLSAGLALVLLSRFFKIGFIETAAWNILVICSMIFLTQGAGIVLFGMARRGIPPVSRFLLNILVVVIIFSPGINAFALGVLLLLGIAENWLPLRVVKQNGPSSTPMM